MIFIKKYDHVEWIAGQPQPCIEPINDPRYKILYKAMHNVSYRWIGHYGGKCDLFRMDRPAGFYSDGQSAPWYARPFGFLPDGICRLPSDVHDAPYRSEGGMQYPIASGINRGAYVPTYIIDAHEGVEYVRERVILGQPACDQLYLHSYLSVAEGNRSEQRRARIGHLALQIGGKRHFGKEMPSKR